MNQQALFINSLFGSNQTEVINVNVIDTHGEKMIIEVYPNGDNKEILPYRIKFKDDSYSLWNSFDSLEDINNKFRIWSIK